MQSIFDVSKNVWTFTLAAFVVAFLCPHTIWVYGAPTTTVSDSNDTTFPLELQPPLIDDGADEDFNGKKRSSSIDSYGNPIDTLKPIETPDGRKVVSAQGLQFEIPNYASGITEIKKPADDLLPPFIDPIAVAETSTTGTDATTTVEVESAHITEVTTTAQAPKQQQQQQENLLSSSILPASSSVVPAYLLALNDPDIGGPAAYVPKDDGSALKVIAWDLLPPHDIEAQIIANENTMTKRITDPLDPKSNNIKLSLSMQRRVNTESNEPLNVGRVSVLNLRTGQDVSGTFTATAKSSTARGTERIMVSLDTTGSQRGLRHETTVDDQSSSSTTAQQQSGSSSTRTISTRVTTTTTPRPTTVTTTTHRPTTVTTTTHRPTTVNTLAKLRSTTSISQKPSTITSSPATLVISTTSDPLDPSTFYKLAAGDSYTLPSWLAEIDDPDLDAAVLYVVPDDIKEYNDTIARDILPPLEPFIDLKDIHLTAPASETTTNTAHRLTSASSGGGSDTTTTTPTTTTTTSTTHPTITRRPTTTTRGTFASTTRPHWIRAYPTTTTSTTTQKPPTSFAFDRSSHPSTTNHNAPPHQSEIGTSPTTFPNIGISTPTQQQQHQTHHNHNHNHHQVQTPSQAHKPSFSLLNKNLPATAADQASSKTFDTSTTPAEKPFGQRNPFLPGFNDHGQPKPFHSAISSRYTTTTTTTSAPVKSTTPRTTTTTTTASSESFEENPFDSSTIPAWLSGYEYDDIGPGVAFNYDSADSKNTVYNNLLPPTNLDGPAMDNIDPDDMTSSPASFHHSFNPPQTTIHPSNVMLTHSLSTNNNNNNNYDDDTEDGDDRSYPIYDSVTEPPIVFVPPTIDEDSVANQRHEHTKKTSSSFNQNFPAPFEPDSDVNGKTTHVDGGHEEPFPPLNGGDNGNASNDSNVPIKATFSKSDEGKVITNNIFLNAASGSPSQAATVKPFVFTEDQKDFPVGSSGIISAPFSGFPTTASGFTKTTPTRSPSSSGVSSTTDTNPGGRYTGRFGGAPGVLGNGKVGYAVQADGSIHDPDHTYRPMNAAVTEASQTSSTQPMIAAFVDRASELHEKKYHGTFGGPPGVLVPYDNSAKAAKP